MQWNLQGTSDMFWEVVSSQHVDGSYRHASLDSQLHHTLRDAPPHLQYLLKTICAVLSSQEKSRCSWSFMQLQWCEMTSWHPKTKTTTISKDGLYKYKHNINMTFPILYLWVIKSVRFGGGITAWSFRSEFFGCKARGFPQWRWDAEGRVGQAEEG